MLSTLRFALGLAPRHPRVLSDYARLSWESRRPRASPRPWAHAGDVLSFAEGLARLQELIGPASAGPAHASVQGADRAGRAAAVPGQEDMAGDGTLGELAYAVVRAVRPEAVVETGVATGVTSSYVLAALADNGNGELHSIDLPPREFVAEGLVGAAIPPPLRTRWSYHWGASRRLLRPVLRGTSGRRVFIHDSDHAYGNMRWELLTAWAAFSAGDVLLGDDAQFHAGFADVATAVGATPLWISQSRGGGVTGVIVRT